MDYKNLFSCKGKVAVVTGGLGLIGKKIVKGLHNAGAKVYIADIKKEGFSKIAKKRGVKYISMDVTLEDSVKKAFKQIRKENNKIDILVNCAYPRTKDWAVKFENVPFDSWKDNVNNHLGGYFLCCRQAAEIMKMQKSGSIINFGSIYGMVAPDFGVYAGTEMTMPAAYAAIKAGVIALTKYIAVYYARFNIRANVISPGGIFNNQDKRFVKQYSGKTPLGRMGYPEDIIGAAIFLASGASEYLTGHNLVIDGGWTIS